MQDQWNYPILPEQMIANINIDGQESCPLELPTDIIFEMEEEQSRRNGSFRGSPGSTSMGSSLYSPTGSFDYSSADSPAGSSGISSTGLSGYPPSVSSTGSSGLSTAGSSGYSSGVSTAGSFGYSSGVSSNGSSGLSTAGSFGYSSMVSSAGSSGVSSNFNDEFQRLVNETVNTTPEDGAIENQNDETEHTQTSQLKNTFHFPNG